MRMRSPSQFPIRAPMRTKPLLNHTISKICQNTPASRLIIRLNHITSPSSYCGCHNKEDVMKCTFKNCNKWFCNGRLKDRLGSHIIIHLVKAKHKEISLHPEGSHGDTALECYVCGNKNIFILGFVPIQSSEESQVIIICRLPCLNSKGCNDLQWDINDWTPIVEEKMIVNWLVKPPAEQDMRRGRHLNIDQINALEELRKLNPEARIEDLDKPGMKKILRDVLLKYENGREYCDVFLPLIEMEAQYDKKVKESQVFLFFKLRIRY